MNAANDQLQVLRKKREEAQRSYERTLDRERKILLRNALSKDRDYQALHKQLEKVKDELHVIRLNITRKGFSVKVRRQQLKKIERSLQTYQEQETQKAQQVHELQQQLRQMREALGNKMQAEVPNLFTTSEA